MFFILSHRLLVFLLPIVLFLLPSPHPRPLAWCVLCISMLSVPRPPDSDFTCACPTSMPRGSRMSCVWVGARDVLSSSVLDPVRECSCRSSRSPFLASLHCVFCCMIICPSPSTHLYMYYQDTIPTSLRLYVPTTGPLRLLASSPSPSPSRQCYLSPPSSLITTLRYLTSTSYRPSYHPHLAICH